MEERSSRLSRAVGAGWKLSEVLPTGPVQPELGGEVSTGCLPRWVPSKPAPRAKGRARCVLSAQSAVGRHLSMPIFPVILPVTFGFRGDSRGS